MQIYCHQRNVRSPNLLPFTEGQLTAHQSTRSASRTSAEALAEACHQTLPNPRAVRLTDFPSEAVVIGDTPADVEVAMENDAQVIAAPSGRRSMAALRKAGAKHVLPDLLSRS